MIYPNGDQAAYVSPVYDARVIGGEMRADGEETSALRGRSPAVIERDLDINAFTRAMLRDVGVLPSQTR